MQNCCELFFSFLPAPAFCLPLRTYTELSPLLLYSWVYRDPASCRPRISDMSVPSHRVRPYVGRTHFSGMFDLPLRVSAKQQHEDFIILRSTKISLFHYFAISLLDIEMSSRCQLLYYYNNEITIIILLYYYC